MPITEHCYTASDKAKLSHVFSIWSRAVVPHSHLRIELSQAGFDPRFRTVFSLRNFLPSACRPAEWLYSCFCLIRIPVFRSTLRLRSSRRNSRFEGTVALCAGR